MSRKRVTSCLFSREGVEIVLNGKISMQFHASGFARYKDCLQIAKLDPGYNLYKLYYKTCISQVFVYIVERRGRDGRGGGGEGGRELLRPGQVMSLSRTYFHPGGYFHTTVVNLELGLATHSPGKPIKTQEDSVIVYLTSSCGLQLALSGHSNFMLGVIVSVSNDLPLT